MGTQNLYNYVRNESGLDESDPAIITTINTLENLLKEKISVNKSNNLAMANLFAKETSMVNTVISFVLKSAVNALSDNMRVSGRVSTLEVA